MSSQDDEHMRNHRENNDLSEESDEENCRSDEEGDDWDEMEQDQEPAKCLFCENVSESIELAIKHLEQSHHIDLGSVKSKFNMDQYSYIKMINYIRTHNVAPEHIQNAAKVLWSDDAYLKPIVVDSWLMFDIDDLTVNDSQNQTTEIVKSDAHQIEDLQRQLKEKDATIEQLLVQMNEMRVTFNALIDRNENKQKGAHGSTDTENSEEQRNVAAIPIGQDQSYFETYAHFHIHHDMLGDTVRTSSYRDAILLNRDLFKGKTVMDVGCGTSILSMFSSQAGAQKVIAVDQSAIIYQAMDIVRRNKIENINFVKGRLENIELPLEKDEKVDILISEWMGYFLLFEGMMDSVIYARDHYLKPGGLLLPNRCNISLVGLGDEQRHNEYVAFWDDVYGFDMSIMQPEVLKEAVVEVCLNEFVITEPVVIADFDLTKVDYTYPNFEFNFELNVKKSGKFTAFVGYFDTFFELPQLVQFSTGPHSTPTHWKQVIFYVKNPVDVVEGEKVCGQFSCRRGAKDARAIFVEIKAFDQVFQYNLS